MKLLKKMAAAAATAAFALVMVPATALAAPGADVMYDAQAVAEQTVLTASDTIPAGSTKTFQFASSSTGKLTLTGSNTESCTVTIQTPEGSTLKSQDSNKLSSTNMASINRSYYINSGKYNVVIKNKSTKTASTLNLKGVVLPVEETFAEPTTGSNNDMSYANVVKPGQKVVGVCSYTDQDDYYKFVVYTKGKVTFSGKIDSLETMHNNLLNSAGSKISMYYRLNPAWTTELDAGVYYLHFQSKSAEYSFEISGSALNNDIAYSEVTTPSSYKYTGATITPAIKIVMGDSTLKKGIDYAVTYAVGRKAVGTYKITIKGIGNYVGSKTFTMKINPKKTSGIKVKSAVKGFTVKWKVGASSQASGYQIRYATTKSAVAKAKVKATLKKRTVVSKTFSKLKSKKTYYVQVRTYKTVKGVKYYSDWSAAKAVRTK